MSSVKLVTGFCSSAILQNSEANQLVLHIKMVSNGLSKKHKPSPSGLKVNLRLFSYTRGRKSKKMAAVNYTRKDFWERCFQNEKGLGKGGENSSFSKRPAYRIHMINAVF